MKHFIKLTFDEAKAALLALMEMERDIKKGASNPQIPWSPDARQTQKEMLKATRSAIQKLRDITGIMDELSDGSDIEPNKYLTKPS